MINNGNKYPRNSVYGLVDPLRCDDGKRKFNTNSLLLRNPLELPDEDLDIPSTKQKREGKAYVPLSKNLDTA